MACNFSGLLRAPIHWEVTLSKKACLNENQSARKRIEYVTANNPAEVKQIIGANQKLAAFRISSIREAR